MRYIHLLILLFFICVCPDLSAQDFPIAVSNSGMGSIYVRTGPNVNMPVIRTLAPGRKLIAIDTQEGWYQVYIPTSGLGDPNSTGWVASGKDLAQPAANIPQLEIIGADVMMKSKAGGGLTVHDLVWTKSKKWALALIGQRFAYHSSRKIDGITWYEIEIPEGFYNYGGESVASTAWLNEKYIKYHYGKNIPVALLPNNVLENYGSHSEVIKQKPTVTKPNPSTEQNAISESDLNPKTEILIQDETFDEEGPNPAIVIPFELSFMNVPVGKKVTKGITIYNDGDGTLDINHISYPSGFEGPMDLTKIEPGSFKTMDVSFYPENSIPYGGNIKLFSNDPSSPHSINVTGETPNNSFFDGSYRELVSKAQKEGKSYIVYFTAPQCGPCKRMKKETFLDSQLTQLMNEKVYFYEANIEYLDALSAAQKFDVSVYPTLIFFSSDGKVIGKLFGYQSARKLVSLIQRYT